MQLRKTPRAEILFYCSPQYQTSALWPVIQHLHRASRFAPEEDDVARRKRLRHFLAALDLNSADVVEPLAMLLGRRGIPAQRILDTFAVSSGLICRAGMPL